MNDDTPDSPLLQEARLWQDDNWTAQVIKNEDDDGWAVAMFKTGASEPALVGPWTMGRDKKNPKPLDGTAFITLVKTASEFVRRSEQQLHEQLNQSVLKKSAAVIHVAFSSFETGVIYLVLLLVIVFMDILPAMSKNNELTGYENYIARTRYMQKVKSDLARETAESIARKSHEDGQRLRDLYKARSIVNRGIGTSLN